MEPWIMEANQGSLLSPESSQSKQANPFTLRVRSEPQSMIDL